MRATISALKGPPSSFSVDWGNAVPARAPYERRFAGVLGIGIGDAFERSICEYSASVYGSPFEPAGPAVALVGLAAFAPDEDWPLVESRLAPEPRRRCSPFELGWPRRSLTVVNLLIRSVWVAGDAPFLLDSGPLDSGGGLVLTATKPPWLGDLFSAANAALAFCPSPFMSATLEGLDARTAAGVLVARRSSMACFRPLRRWLS